MCSQNYILLNLAKNPDFSLLSSNVTNERAYYSRGLLSLGKQPVAFVAGKIITLTKFLLDLSGQGLDWGPHAQLTEPTAAAAVECLTSPHFPHPTAP